MPRPVAGRVVLGGLPLAGTVVPAGLPAGEYPLLALVVACLVTISSDAGATGHSTGNTESCR